MSDETTHASGNHGDGSSSARTMSTPRCTAKSKTTGQQCRQPVVPGSTKCHYHGGRSLSGIASPAFRTGRYSSALPARLLATYNAVVDDPDLLELRSSIAVLDALIVDKIRQLDTDESGKVWDGLRKTWRDLRLTTGSSQAQRDRRNSLMLEIGELIDRGAGPNAATNDLIVLLDNRRKLVREEAARLKSMAAMVTAEEAMSLVGALATLVREHVTDPTALAAIQSGVSALLVRHATPVGA